MIQLPTGCILEDIQKVVPFAKNPKEHTDKDIELIIKSIQRNGWGDPVLVCPETMEILSGNGRYMAAKKLGMEQIPVVYAPKGLTEKQKADLVIASNKLVEISGYNDNLGALVDEFELDLEDFGIDIDNPTAKKSDKLLKGSLADKFITSPFSVLNAKAGDWQNRKKLWLNKGLKSEVGRDENLLMMSLQVKYPSYYDQKAKIEAKLGYELSKEEFEEKYLDRSHPLSTTSIFDPVLCEVLYSWFSKTGDSIIDPFAGGSVRGVIANYLDRQYTGIDLRKEQIDANYDNAKEIVPENIPNWICGDSNKVLDTLQDDEYNMCLSCPPYADLEVYSDDKDDLSNMDYPDFVKVYGSIIKKLYSKMKDNSFVAWVIGEVRSKNGNYYNFVGDTIKCFLDAGFNYYNEIILETSIGTSAMRATKMFKSGRKVCKVHQNVLIFVKGDGKKATERIGDVDIIDIKDDEI